MWFVLLSNASAAIIELDKFSQSLVAESVLKKQKYQNDISKDNQSLSCYSSFKKNTILSSELNNNKVFQKIDNIVSIKRISPFNLNAFYELIYERQASYRNIHHGKITRFIQGLSMINEDILNKFEKKILSVMSYCPNININFNENHSNESNYDFDAIKCSNFGFLVMLLKIEQFIDFDHHQTKAADDIIIENTILPANHTKFIQLFRKFFIFINNNNQIQKVLQIFQDNIMIMLDTTNIILSDVNQLEPTEVHSEIQETIKEEIIKQKLIIIELYSLQSVKNDLLTQYLISHLMHGILDAMNQLKEKLLNHFEIFKYYYFSIEQLQNKKRLICFNFTDKKYSTSTQRIIKFFQKCAMHNFNISGLTSKNQQYKFFKEMFMPVELQILQFVIKRSKLNSEFQCISMNTQKIHWLWLLLYTILFAYQLHTLISPKLKSLIDKKLIKFFKLFFIKQNDHTGINIIEKLQIDLKKYICNWFNFQLLLDETTREKRLLLQNLYKKDAIWRYLQNSGLSDLSLPMKNIKTKLLCYVDDLINCENYKKRNSEIHIRRYACNKAKFLRFIERNNILTNNRLFSQTDQQIIKICFSYLNTDHHFINPNDDEFISSLCAILLYQHKKIINNDHTTIEDSQADLLMCLEGQTNNLNSKILDQNLKTTINGLLSIKIQSPIWTLENITSLKMKLFQYIENTPYETTEQNTLKKASQYHPIEIKIEQQHQSTQLTELDLYSNNHL